MSTRYVWKTASSTYYEDRFSATEPGKYGVSVNGVPIEELTSAGYGFIRFGTNFTYDSSAGTYSLVNEKEFLSAAEDYSGIDGTLSKRVVIAYRSGSQSNFNKGALYQFALSADRRTLYYAAIDPYAISSGSFDRNNDDAFWDIDGSNLALYMYDSDNSSPTAAGRIRKINFYKFSSVQSGSTDGTSGYATSSNRNAYSGATYPYYGSDEPDLLTISYNTENLKPLDDISIKITSPTLGSLLSLYPTQENTAHVTTIWQVNINNGGWNDLEDNLAEDSGVYIFGGSRTRGFTIPVNATSIQYRVYAKDGLGWVGDYVTGPVIYFNGSSGGGSDGTSGKVWVGVGNTARQATGVWVGVNGVAKKVIAMWVGVNGVAKKVF